MFDFVHRPANPSVIVIFIHGLGGDPATTWTAGAQNLTSENWLNWLVNNHQDWLICAHAHESPSFGRSEELKKKAQNLCQSVSDEFGGIDVPIVFVAHSFGGLLVKQAIVQFRQHQNTGGAQSHIADRINGVVFIATPHRPNDFAWTAAFANDLADRLSREIIANSYVHQATVGRLWGVSRSVHELADDKLLSDLRSSYRNAALDLNIKHRILVEGLPLQVQSVIPNWARRHLPTQLLELVNTALKVSAQIVTYEDASPELPYQEQETYVCTGHDHFTIAAPSSPRDPVVEKVEAFICRTATDHQFEPSATSANFAPPEPPSYIQGQFGRWVTDCLAAHPDCKAIFIAGPHGAGKTTLIGDLWSDLDRGREFNVRHRFYFEVADQSGPLDTYSIREIATVLAQQFRSSTQGTFEQILKNLSHRLCSALDASSRALVVIDGLEAARINERTQTENEYPHDVWQLLSTLGCVENLTLIVLSRGGMKRADGNWAKLQKLVPVLSAQWCGLNFAWSNVVLEQLGIQNREDRAWIISENQDVDQWCLPADLVLAAKHFQFHRHANALFSAPSLPDDNVSQSSPARKRAIYVDGIFEGYKRVSEDYDRSRNQTGTGHLELAILQVVAQAMNLLARSDLKAVFLNMGEDLLPRHLLEEPAFERLFTEAMKRLVEEGLLLGGARRALKSNDRECCIGMATELRRAFQTLFVRKLKNTNAIAAALEVVALHRASVERDAANEKNEIGLLFACAHYARQQGEHERSFREIYLERIQQWRGEGSEKNRLWGRVDERHVEHRYLSGFVDADDGHVIESLRLATDMQLELYLYWNYNARSIGDTGSAELATKNASRVINLVTGSAHAKAATHCWETLFHLGQVSEACEVIWSRLPVSADAVEESELFPRARQLVFAAYSLAVSRDQDVGGPALSLLWQAQRCQAKDREAYLQSLELGSAAPKFKPPERLMGVQGFFYHQTLLATSQYDSAHEYANYLVEAGRQNELQPLAQGLAHLALAQSLAVHGRVEENSKNQLLEAKTQLRRGQDLLWTSQVQHFRAAMLLCKADVEMQLGHFEQAFEALEGTRTFLSRYNHNLYWVEYHLRCAEYILESQNLDQADARATLASFVDSGEGLQRQFSFYRFSKQFVAIREMLASGASARVGSV